MVTQVTEQKQRNAEDTPTLRETVEKNQGDVKTARAMLQDTLTGNVVDEVEALQVAINVLDQVDERANDVLEDLE